MGYPAKSGMRTAFCGILTALASVFMILVPVLPVLMYCCPLLSGMCVAIAAKEYGARYAAFVYAAASIVSLLLVADKEAVSVFVLLMGAYPILSYVLKKRSFGVRISIKLVYINSAAIIYYFICVLLLGIPKDSFGSLPLIMLAAANLIMLMYDRAIESVAVVYERKFRKKIMKGKM